MKFTEDELSKASSNKKDKKEKKKGTADGDDLYIFAGDMEETKPDPPPTAKPHVKEATHNTAEPVLDSDED